MIGPDENGNLVSALTDIAEGDVSVFPSYERDLSGKEQRLFKKASLQAVSENGAYYGDEAEMSTASDGAASFDPGNMMKLLKSMNMDVRNDGEALDGFSFKRVLHNFGSADIVDYVNY